MNIIPFISRIIITALFLTTGIQKIFTFQKSVIFLEAYAVPLANVFVTMALIIEIVGGLMILLGFKGRWAALGLAIYLIPLTLILHTNLLDQNQQIQFLKNLAILGGLLYIYNFGTGALSLKKAKNNDS